MDPGSIILAMGLGATLTALFAVAGAIATRKLEPKRRQQIMIALMAVSVGITAGLAPLIGRTKLGEELQVALGLRRRSEIVAKRAMQHLFDEPSLRREFEGKNDAEVRAHAARLAAEGILYLDQDKLERWGTLRARLAAASPKLCAAMWKGGIAQGQVLDALDSLSPREQEEWAEISKKAMLLALDDRAPRPARSVTLQEGIAEVVALFPEEQRNAFLFDAARPDLPDAKACELARTLFEGALRLEPGRRAEFYRALAAGS